VIVVADTSVVINLCCVSQGDLLRQLFREVVVPPAVAVEFARLASSVPRFAGLSLPEGIRRQAATTLPALLRSSLGLDPGETAALALAVEIHADAVLLDERRGREVASQLGLRTIGFLGLLLQAKSAGLLPSVRPILNDLQRKAGFWVAEPLRRQPLRLAGEGP
jgi:predicted nucleic acid-binding protein